MKRMKLVAVSLCVAAMGCFTTDPIDARDDDDFDVVEVALFAVDDGAFCPTSMSYDDVEDEVLLLDYHEGVHRYSVDGAYLGTTVESRDEWVALSPYGFTFIGGAEVALTSGVGDPYKMELSDGALTAWPMGVTLGSVMAFDRGRNTIVAQETESWNLAGTGPTSTLFRIDATSGLPTGEMTVAAGGLSAIAYASDLDAYFVAGFDGELLLVDGETGDTIGKSTGSFWGLAYDASRARLYGARASWGYEVATYKIDWRE